MRFGTGGRDLEMVDGLVRFGRTNARVLVALLVVGALAVASAGDPPPAAYILDQDDFTGVATRVLEYLGYAVVAGLSILVSVVAARRGWSFLRRFL